MAVEKERISPGTRRAGDSDTADMVRNTNLRSLATGPAVNPLLKMKNSGLGNNFAKESSNAGLFYHSRSGVVKWY